MSTVIGTQAREDFWRKDRYIARDKHIYLCNVYLYTHGSWLLMVKFFNYIEKIYRNIEKPIKNLDRTKAEELSFKCFFQIYTLSIDCLF